MDFTIQNRRCRPWKHGTLCSKSPHILRCSLVERLSPKQGERRLVWLVWHLYVTLQEIPLVPSWSVATTLNFSHLSPPSFGHSFPSHLASFPNSLSFFIRFMPKTSSTKRRRIKCLLLPMHCKRGEKDGLPPRQAGWAATVLSWLAAVKIAPGVTESLPFRNSDSLKVTRARIHRAAASFPLCFTLVLWTQE